MNERYYIGQREYGNDGFNIKVIRECKDYFKAMDDIKDYAEIWAGEGYIVDTFEDREVVAHDEESGEVVFDYQIMVEYIPQPNVIDPTIKGFDFVKNVVYAYGSERTECDLLFVVRRSGDGEYLRNLCEVAENTGFEAYKALEAKYPNEEYIIWHGCVRSMPKGSARMPSGGDIIDFYWS